MHSISLFACVPLSIIFLSSLSIQSMAHGAPGLLGQTVMGAPDRPLAPGYVTVLLPGLVACPVLEKLGRHVVAMTTSPSVQVSKIKH